MSFDAKGEITTIRGNPILIDSSIPMAEDVVSELEKWKKPLEALFETVIEDTRVNLNGELWQLFRGRTPILKTPSHNSNINFEKNKIEL